MEKIKFSTSLSDVDYYYDACIQASLNGKLFNKFRRNKSYRRILEHISQKRGNAYLKEILDTNPGILKNSDIFRQNDEWGNPLTYDYPEIGQMSPSTIRYIKVLSDLELIFGSLDNLNICEIGGGYGGQCRIINSIYKPKKYTLVDIKASLMLAQRYLDKYVLNSVMEFKTMNELEIANYDLIISNYAFTELTREVQSVYLNKAILNSTKGYITYNDIVPESFNSYKKNELLQLLKGSFEMEERPLTHDNNCIIVWGGNKIT